MGLACCRVTWDESLSEELSTFDGVVPMLVGIFLTGFVGIGRPTLNVGSIISQAWLWTE